MSSSMLPLRRTERAQWLRARVSWLAAPATVPVSWGATLRSRSDRWHAAAIAGTPEQKLASGAIRIERLERLLAVVEHPYPVVSFLPDTLDEEQSP